MDEFDRPKRLLGVDAARLLAIMGMFAAHLFPLSTGSAQEPYSPTFTGAVANGRASVLFMVLAGISLTLLSTSLRRKGFSNPKVYSVLILRALIIAVLGLLIGPANEGIAIILVHYGLLFLLLSLALRLSRLTIWTVSSLWLLIMPILWRPLALSWAGQNLGHNPDLRDLLTPGLLIKDLFVTGYYPLMIWIGFGLLGIALGRTVLGSPRTAALLAGGGTVMALFSLAAGWLLTAPLLQLIAAVQQLSPPQALTLVVVGRLPGGSLDPLLDSPLYLALPAAHSGSLVFTVHAAACAVALVGLMQLVVPQLAALGKFLAGAGRAPLTLYVGHLLVLPALQDHLEPTTIWWLLCAATAALGLWLGFTRATGPLEYCVRVLSGADAEPPRRDLSTRQPVD